MIHIPYKKSLGQNFLINSGILNKIVSAAELGPDDIVLEIGPGTGNLTKLLSEKAGRVIAVEKDRRLIPELQEKFKNTNIEIIEADVLKLDIEELFRNLKLLGEGSRVKPGISVEIINSDYKIIGNIPYYITSNLLRTIFEKWPRPELIVLTVQKEVAKRIVAKPPDMNLLALSVQFYSDAKIISYVSKGSFRPTPRVDSAIISLKPKAESLKPTEKELFFKLIKTGFSGKRKQLVNNLTKNFGMMKKDLLRVFEEMGINPDTRAENLSLNQWIELSKLITK